MRRFEPGDRVRVDIPDTEDPDFDRYHGRHGEVVEVIDDDAGQETGDERDAHLFTVAFEEAGVPVVVPPHKRRVNSYACRYRQNLHVFLNSSVGTPCNSSYNDRGRHP